MTSTIELGPITIYWYSIFILCGIIAGYVIARPAGKRAGFTPAQLEESILWALIPGAIGARTYHVIDQWQALYANQPLEVFAFWHGGLGILGGLAGGALGLWLFCRRYKISYLTLLDIYAPSTLLAQAIGRLGNWTNQEAFGPPTTLPWGIYISPENRPIEYLTATQFHPTFFYEMGIDLLGVAILLLLRKRLATRPGRVLGLYFILYGTGRFIVEFFRFDTANIAGVNVAHVISATLVVAGIYLLLRDQRRQRHNHAEPQRKRQR